MAQRFCRRARRRSLVGSAICLAGRFTDVGSGDLLVAVMVWDEGEGDKEDDVDP